MVHCNVPHMHCTECTTAGLRRCLTQLGLCPPLTSTLDQSSIIQSKTLHTALLDTSHCINVYHCLGGLLHSTLYCTFETILELFYWRRHTLGHILAPGTCVLLSLEQRWERTCVSVCVTHCVDKASFRFHRKASRKV